VFLADNGSTAVEIALKMALQAQAQRGQPRRTRFVALENAYHGETAATLSVGDLDLYAAPYRALCFPVGRLTGLPYRRGPDDPKWLDAGAEWPAIEAALDAQAETLAAIVYEPVLQAAGGMVFFSPDLLRRLRAWRDAHGVYLIADEIAAGMGRLGAVLASHLADGRGPDLDRGAARLRRAVEGLDRRRAAAVGRADDRRRSTACSTPTTRTGRAFLHSNTFTGNALAVAVALAVLDVFADEDVLGRVHGARARASPRPLRKIAEDRPYLRNVRGCGMAAAVDIPRRETAGRSTRAGATGWHVYREAVPAGRVAAAAGRHDVPVSAPDDTDDELTRWRHPLATASMQFSACRDPSVTGPERQRRVTLSTAS
jgi:adenosylmethionine-8-amino-7-oxononanoate aminotransferase